jgi:hypothetical protein
MRRARDIVNEMEFRMLREAKSFSPSPRTDAMKGFSRRRLPAMDVATSHRHHLHASFLRAPAVFSSETFQ